MGKIFQSMDNKSIFVDHTTASQNIARDLYRKQKIEGYLSVMLLYPVVKQALLMVNLQ